METLRQAAIEALGRSDFRAAERACDKLAKAGAAAEATYMRGVMKQMQGKPLAAIPLLKLASDEQPARADILYNYGVALRDANRLDDAIPVWRRAVTLAPDRVDAWRNLALAAAGRCAGEEAISTYREALALHPADRELLYNAGNLAYRLGDLDAATAWQTQLTETHPAYAPGWMNAALTNRAKGDLTRSEEQYRRAIALHPHESDDPAQNALAHFNLANLLLSQDRWSEGFAEYEWRRQLPGAASPPWPAPRWTPDLPAGSRVLLWNDQGLGDALQFLRFAGTLAERYRVLFFGQNALKTLAATAPGIGPVFTPADTPQQIDAQLPLSSLPHALGLTPENSFARPYLSAPKTNLLGERKDDRLRIGLVWAGNPDHPNDAHRSMKLADLAPLFGLPSVEWVSLQVGRGREDLAASSWPILDLAPLLTDLSVTASVMQELDLVISVDTAPAHLAGALGRPTFVALPLMGLDWRWGISGGASLWYPSMRLFRQTRDGDWSPLVAEMRCLIAKGDLPRSA